jgi:hypothetical protein
MTAPARVKLGSSTVNRKWYVDVNTGTFGTPVWTPVCGLTEFQPVLTPTLQDDSDFDSEGDKSSVVTARAWSCSGTLARKVTVADAEAYDPGQEVLRLASEEIGGENVVDARFYEMTPDGPRVEAYRGNAAVSWSPNGGGMDALSSVAFTLTGQGRRTLIAHPDAA